MTHLLLVVILLINKSGVRVSASDQRLQLSADPGSAVSEVKPGHDERPSLHRIHDGTFGFKHGSDVGAAALAHGADVFFVRPIPRRSWCPRRANSPIGSLRGRSPGVPSLPSFPCGGA